MNIKKRKSYNKVICKIIQASLELEFMRSFRKQRVKLVKDVEAGQNTLRQSLLDISQFENINEAFEKKKLAFNIQKRQIAIKPYTPVSQDAKQYDMTPTQKLDLYKKKKIKERYNQSFLNSSASIQMLKKMFKIRKSKIPSMLNNLNETMKKQVQQKFQKQIKRSQQKLKFFRSQGKIDQEQFYTKSQYLSQNKKGNQNREKFYSLKTGRPQMNQKLFPTFQQYVQGKNRAKLQQKYYFDVSKIQKQIRSFYTEVDSQNPEENQQIERNQTKGTVSTGRLSKAQTNSSQGLRSAIGIMSQRNPVCRTQSMKRKFRIDSNIKRYSQQQIEKSQLSSSKLVKTMRGFYNSKNTKKSEYNNMVSFYDHDRPLTNSIRRQKYEFISSQAKIKELNHYRHKCEQQRKQILLSNSVTYKNILKILQKYHQDDIPVSIQILRSIRQLMKKQYVFAQEQVRKVLRQIKKKFSGFLKIKKQGDFNDQTDQKEDFMIQPVINVLNKAYGFNILWIDP